MARFIIHAERIGSAEIKKFIYDNQTSELLTEDGTAVEVQVPKLHIYKKDAPAVFAVSSDAPGKKGQIKTLKIALGLSCNYECSYCSQRFVPRADETNAHDLEPFLESLEQWLMPRIKNPDGEGLRIEFWGGEPFVYWKTLKPLAERLRTRLPKVTFNVITNGSLLDLEKNAWLDEMGFGVGISHDGPGQHVRGPDPLQDPEKAAAIKDLFLRLRPKGRVSFNAMVNRDNQSRAAIVKFFSELTGDPQLQMGEGAFVDPYDEGGLASSLKPDELVAFRLNAFREVRNGSAAGMNIVKQKVSDFIESIANRRPARLVGQKCGMDRTDNIAVDLKGNVLTCQNVSAVSVAPNGEAHKIGHVSDYENIQLKTSTHWSKREECPKCPVLQLCKGSCMFLEGNLWDAGCDNSFSDNIPFFAAAIEFITGYVPVYIEGPHRRDRWDIFGLRKENVPTPKPARRVIPIKVAA